MGDLEGSLLFMVGNDGVGLGRVGRGNVGENGWSLELDRWGLELVFVEQLEAF